MKEIRLQMSDAIHLSIKQYATEKELKVGEAVEVLVLLGLKHTRECNSTNGKKG